MVRLIILLLVVSLGCKMVFGRWPWDYLRPQSTRAQALFRARQLLGVSKGADHREVIEAHRRLIAMIHPDRGGTNDQVHEANAARDLLLGELPDRS